MFTDAERAFVAGARVGRLATADDAARPHVVPVCYALVGDGTAAGDAPDGPDDGPPDSPGDESADRPRVVTPIDEKPKSTTELRRVRDVRANPHAALIVDRYAADWSRLGWVQVRGRAAVLSPGDAGHGAAVDALRVKYDQYADHDLGSRPVVALDPAAVRSWGDLTPPGSRG